MGYGGLVLGPVVIGFLSDVSSLRVGLGVAAVLGLLIAAGARYVPMRRLVAFRGEREVERDTVTLAA
jgi:MFS family permease